MKRPQRVLVVHPGPEFSVADVFTGWMEALGDLDIRVADYNLGDRLVYYFSSYVATGNEDDDGHPEFKKALDRDQAVGLAANGILSNCYQFWPDVVLIVSCFYIPPGILDVMRDRGHKVVLLHTESPYQDTEQLERAAHADLNLLNDPVNIAAYQAVAPAAYMPHAYRPAIHHTGPGLPEYATDFCFAGTGFPSRIEFFEQMLAAGAFDRREAALAGNWSMLEDSPLRKLVAHDLHDCVGNEAVAQMYRAGTAGLNLYRREAENEHHGEGWALGPREVEMAACGLFFLRDPRGESDEVFPMLPTFDGPQDAAEKLGWWLAHGEARQRAAVKAREAIRPRTFGSNAQALLKLLGDL